MRASSALSPCTSAGVTPPPRPQQRVFGYDPLTLPSSASGGCCKATASLRWYVHSLLSFHTHHIRCTRVTYTHSLTHTVTYTHSLTHSHRHIHSRTCTRVTRNHDHRRHTQSRPSPAHASHIITTIAASFPAHFLVRPSPGLLRRILRVCYFAHLRHTV